MLEQYRQDYSTDADALSESRFQMSRRKLVFTLAGSAVALISFLFLIGAFQSDEATPEQSGQVAIQDTAQVPSDAADTRTVDAKLQDLQARVDRLEKLSLPANAQPAAPLTTPVASAPAENTNNFDPLLSLNDQTLKELIASEEAATEPTDPESAPQSNQDNTTGLSKATAATASSKTATPRTYVVQRGDTLSKISLQCYGTTKRWKEIFNANRDRISNMNQLKVGTKLTIPEEKK